LDRLLNKIKMERDNELRKIKEEVIACQRCHLFRLRKYPVIGEGNHKAKIVFVGEAPGREENASGRPFVGQAGKILNSLLKSIGLKREDVYITNILKCRPPRNRDPEENEIIACSPFLKKQIEIINPKVVCSLGRYAMNFLMDEFGLGKEIEPISKAHGKIFKVKSGPFLIPFYHPAVAVYNASMKNCLIEDFKILRKFK